MRFLYSSVNCLRVAIAPTSGLGDVSFGVEVELDNNRCERQTLTVLSPYGESTLSLYRRRNVCIRRMVRAKSMRRSCREMEEPMSESISDYPAFPPSRCRPIRVRCWGHVFVLVLSCTLLMSPCFAEPSVRLSWSPNAIVVDTACMPADGLLYLFLSGFDSDQMRGIQIDATRYRDDPSGLKVTASGVVSGDVGWTESVAQAEWGEHRAELKIRDDFDVVAVKLQEPSACREATVVVSYAMVDLNGSVAYADVSSARAYIAGGSQLKPPVHVLDFAPRTARSAASLALTVYGGNVDQASTAYLMRDGGMVHGAIVEASQESVQVQFQIPAGSDGEWRVGLRGVNEDMSTQTLLVLPASASGWPPGRVVWKGGEGQATTSLFGPGEPCPMSGVMTARALYALDNAGNLGNQLDSELSLQVGLIETQSGFIYESNRKLKRVNHNGQVLWETEQKHLYARYAAESDVVLCFGGGGHGSFSGLGVRLVKPGGVPLDLGTGFVTQAEPVVGGFVVDKVDDASAGRGYEVGHTLVKYDFDGNHEWSTPVAEGFTKALGSDPRGERVLLALAQEGNLSIVPAILVLDAETGAILAAHEFAPQQHPHFTPVLGSQGDTMYLFRHTETYSKCVEMVAFNVETGTEQWRRVVDCVEDWGSDWGATFAISREVSVAPMSGDLAISLFWLVLDSSGRPSQHQISKVLVVDRMGNEVLDHIVDGDVVYKLEFLDSDRFLSIHLRDETRIVVVR